MGKFDSRANPARSYDDALARLGALQARDDDRINPKARTHLRSHGHKTENSAVLLHGLTNCPAQFLQLGELFFERGYNVLIPRLPRHGLLDRLTDELSGLTAQELVTATDEAIDIAAGLGERVTVAGLSMGGVLAGWAAQVRRDVDRAVLISPAFGMMDMSMLRVNLISRLALLLPNRFMWWDSEATEANGPPHTYPRFSTHALAHVFRVGQYVYAQAAKHPPAARSIVMIYNTNDHAVSNPATEQLVERWKSHGAFVTSYTFDNLSIPHDLIDPAQPYQAVDRVYPILIEQACAP